jgi:serine/threonine protein phosphatase PrpC
MSEQAAAPTPAASTGRLVVQAVLRTDVGLVRSENQDFGTYTTPQEEAGAHPGGRLLVVADGMGGHRGGATASRLAGETVKAQYLGSDGDDVPAALLASLTRANARIFSEAQANPDLRGMGTTTSALAIRGNHAWFGHVGDSRIYRVRAEKIEQMTDDHSLVATMVREGLLTTKEAETHPRRNVLQRSMGVAEEVEIDVRGPFQIEEGDTFILCSDGLHGTVKEDEMKEVVTSKAIDAAADEFIRLAIQRGAPDNVTVIVARVVRAEPGDDDVTQLERKSYEDTQPLITPDPHEAITAPVPVITEEMPALPPPAPAVEPSVDDTLRIPGLAAELVDTVETPIEPGTLAAPSGERVSAEGPGEEQPPAPDESSAREESPSPLVPLPAPRGEGNEGRGSMTWLWVLIVLVAAAGAWFFFSR